MLRALRCSFEVEQTLLEESNQEGTGDPDGDDNSASDAPWSRSPGLPSWNDCFRCGGGGAKPRGTMMLGGGMFRSGPPFLNFSSRGRNALLYTSSSLSQLTPDACCCCCFINRCMFDDCRNYTGPPGYSKRDVAEHCPERSSSASEEQREGGGGESGSPDVILQGLYAYQLEVWLGLFPQEQLLVLNHEEVRKGRGIVR